MCTNLSGYRYGMCFLEIGQDVHIVGGDLSDAVNEGVRRGYDKGYLRSRLLKTLFVVEIQETILLL